MKLLENRQKQAETIRVYPCNKICEIYEFMGFCLKAFSNLGARMQAEAIRALSLMPKSNQKIKRKIQFKKNYYTCEETGKCDN